MLKFEDILVNNSDEIYNLNFINITDEYIINGSYKQDYIEDPSGKTAREILAKIVKPEHLKNEEFNTAFFFSRMISNNVKYQIKKTIDFYIEKANLTNNVSEEFIYIIKTKCKKVKIGRSKNHRFRLKTLSRSGGFIVDDYKFFGPFKKASEIETKLHKYFDKEKLIGEWFDCKIFDKAIEMAQIMTKSF